MSKFNWGATAHLAAIWALRAAQALIFVTVAGMLAFNLWHLINGTPILLRSRTAAWFVTLTVTGMWLVQWGKARLRIADTSPIHWAVTWFMMFLAVGVDLFALARLQSGRELPPTVPLVVGGAYVLLHAFQDFAVGLLERLRSGFFGQGYVSPERAELAALREQVERLSVTREQPPQLSEPDPKANP